MARSVILSAVRTPFGKLGGALAGYRATDLGALVIAEALARAGIEPHEPQYVVVGQVVQAGAGQAPARQASLAAGLPLATPAETLNKVCASSLRAVALADALVRAGDVDLVVTGGMESMSQAPFALARARFGYRLGDGTLSDLLLTDGLVSTVDGRHMIEQASFVARELGIGRDEQDAWAYRSHRRAIDAADAGRFADELVLLPELDHDESPRRDTTLERLAALAPVLDPEGTTTAGNAPGLNDGASCVVVASERWARERGLEPLATVLAQGAVADEVAYLARTPAKAAELALAAAGETIGDVARVEINEAFASVALHSTRLLGADEERVNVNGGAVALGHPIGATGGRLVATLVHELRRAGGGLGLAAICSGGGQGDALWSVSDASATVRAAGGVVVRDGRVLVVHRRRYDDWSLPKGKLEPGESWEEAALREVEEETGLRCTLGEEVGRSFYLDAAGRDKEVRYFRMRSDDDAVAQHEIDALAWVPLEEAPTILSYPRDAALLAALA